MDEALECFEQYVGQEAFERFDPKFSFRNPCAGAFERFEQYVGQEAFERFDAKFSFRNPCAGAFERFEQYVGQEAFEHPTADHACRIHLPRCYCVDMPPPATKISAAWLLR